MAGILDFLKSAGNVAGTGLGVALTPLAMVQAAQRGQNPLGLLDEWKAEQENRQLEGLLTRAKATQEPGVRNLLVGQPGLAGGFGLETVPGGIASPEVLAQARATGATPGERVPILPQRFVSPQETTAASQQAYFDQLVKMAQGNQPGGARVTYGPSGPSIAPPPTMDVKEGEINPATNEPYKPAEIGPTGAQVRRVIPTGTTRTTQQTQNVLNRIRGARAQLNTLTGPLADPKTKKPYLKEDGTPITYQDALLGEDVGSALFGEAPFLPEARTRIRARMGGGSGAASQALSSMGGSISAAARIGGEVGNLAQEEQKRFSEAFIPNSRDSTFSGPLKIQFFNETMDRIEEALTAGATKEQIGDMFRDAMASAENIGKGGTPGTPPPVAGAGLGGEVPDEVKSARDFIRNLGAPVARAEGGPVAPRQIALVGENGPEIAQSAGPMTITPLQRGLGPGVSAPNYGAAAPAAPAVRQLQPRGGGVMSGEGLTPAEASAVRGGAKGTITLGPDGLPVFVRQ